MGATVRLLDETLVDQIAAGEVIERPANLVKELLENAIDAKATAITVSLEDGGRGQVRVTDDGVGMSRDDAELAIQRHATSKIATFEDLVRVATLGFRGEALPSIGSVSKMTITTRPEGDLEGTRVVVEGGALGEIAPAGCPPGTTVEVTDLFYNVPARKKFLRARQTETSRIFEVCQRVALSHPELRLTVSSDGRQARQYLPVRSLSERAYQVFGDIPLREIHAQRDGVTLDAVLAPADHARAGARHLFLLVNGRPISDRALARAIAFAYGPQLPPGHYPRGVVSIRVPHEEVDVNAHPQKTEVRFRRPAQLLDLVTRMLAPHVPSAPAGDAYWDARAGAGAPVAAGTTSEPPTRATSVAQSEEPYDALPANGLRLVAQVQDTFLVCETADALLVIDRERADALRRLEALRRDLERGQLGRHVLLFPDRIELTPSRTEALERDRDLLETIGFDWSALGNRTHAVRTVPAQAADARAAAVFDAAGAVLEREREPTVEAVLTAVADASATPNGEPVPEDAAKRIAAALSPSQPEHQSSIVARIAIPPSKSTQTHD